MNLLIGVCIGVAVYVLHRWIRKDAAMRHARYKMRARLARLVYQGRLRDIYVKR